MIKSGIQISWDYADEYIELDLNELNRLPSIKSTIEWWRNRKRWVRYKTSSEMKLIGNGIFEICIIYNRKINNHIPTDDACWGKSIIRIDTTAKTGTANWFDSDDISHNGEVNITIINNDLTGDKNRSYVSKIQRQQEQFRSALLLIDECCVITGEKTQEALEAAHIIPAKDRGKEVIGNGILLRADLHRLFDANLFLINDDGTILISDKVDTNYKKLLVNARIPCETLNRIKEALNLSKRRLE